MAELELSEQRVSSLRERLSRAVTKGKGLIVQRDSLKQSITEASGELDKCSHELQLKDARLNELETKLKTYSEAGERMEALESELSYIRNSATALRESFLLKDSVLQRIEEILEDLELPENFHSRGIIEKIDWLARSIPGNSLQLPDWDQKSSVGGGSYSDTGFVVMDAWKEDAQLNSSSGDDLRRKYEELQNKFYGLAEQNEMLEQSLTERNNLVQRWEEILDRIDMPSKFQSMEPEDRIEWLGAAISEAQNHCESLQQKIDNLESFCGSLAADLEESQRRVSDLETALQSVVSEKEHLAKCLETLTRDYDEVSEKSAQFGVMNDKLQNEVTALQEKLDMKLEAEDHMHHVEGQVRRLQDLLNDVLQDPVTEDIDCGSDSTRYLEQLLRKLIEKYATLSVAEPATLYAMDENSIKKVDPSCNEIRIRGSEDARGHDVAALRKSFEEALGELMLVKEERNTLIKNNLSLVHEVEAVDMKRQQLQELLNLEQQRSASLREKLNDAVRKGKSLVQQRDRMKQAIEDVNSEAERLKSEIRLQEISLSEYEQKIRNLSTYQERVEAMETEDLFLRNRLAETEHYLQENRHNLSRILSTLGNVDVGFELNISDPIEKLEQLGKVCRDLHAIVASSEHESRKSKRAAELLLAELNEVQERNDAFQEELAKVTSELSELSKERDLAEAAKGEALAQLDKLSSVNSEERDEQFAELVALKSGLDQLREGLFAIDHLLGDVLSKDLNILHDLGVSVKSFLQSVDAPNVAGLSIGVAPGSITYSNLESKIVLSTDSWSDSKKQELFSDNFFIELCSFMRHHLEGLTTETCVLEERLHKHSHSFHEEANHISEVLGTIHREMTSQKQSFESMNRDVIRLESIEKEKHKEVLILHRNLSMLYEACASSVKEIENWKSQVVGNCLASGPLGINLEFSTSIDGENHFSGQALLPSEDSIRTTANKLLAAVKDFTSMQTEVAKVGQMEMNATISNLQNELQEKDVQNNRICLELVNQIKEAKSAAKVYLQDLQYSKAQVLDLERQVHLMEEERPTMEQRIKELENQEASSINLEERVLTLTDTLAAKEQEIEALMQALDEEEMQMEGLTNTIGELENVLQKKNLDLESLESSHGKAVKKLSITVRKFDELHHLSAGLLSELEKLQSLVQDRDSEISFLRQEVTRCTNDALAASQLSSMRNSDEIRDLLTWLDTMVPQAEVHDVQFDDIKSDQGDEYKKILKKRITSVISELEGLQVVAQKSERLLHMERSRVEELARQGELLKNSLDEKESELVMLRGVGDSGQAAASMTSEIMEVEPLINKRSIPGTSVTPQVRSLRKANADQVSIAIDVDPGSGGSLEEEDDDKAHGFKSLTTSRVVPRFTRPVTDVIDGLWVSCDRALMRQPALRLGVIIYWAILHALLATFVV